MVLEELEGQKRERESYGAKRRKDEATQEFVIVFSLLCWRCKNFPIH